LLLWIKNSLSPQEIRDRIMDSTSDFQKQMVEYLESVHQGELLNEKPLTDMLASFKSKQEQTGYSDPTKTMPKPPPELCKSKNCTDCSKCKELNEWWVKFEEETNDILARSNRH
ncbi:hypothetical protein GALMADRAFT_45486, partial [Galerina marginata CBS 339.88]